jgi:reactive intermediate/imine deaminase
MTPYRDVVEAGQLVFVSGKLGRRNGDVVPGGARAETEQAMLNVKESLERVGLGLSDVIKITVYLSSISDWDDMNRGYLAALGAHRPARSSVGVEELPAGARIELDVIAYRREVRR